MNNNTEYLGTYPELGQIYFNARVCERNKKACCTLPTPLYVDIHNKIFEALISLSKRIVEQKMPCSTRYDWKSRIADLVHANMVCMNEIGLSCSVLKVLLALFQELKIEI